MSSEFPQKRTTRRVDSNAIHPRPQSGRNNNSDKFGRWARTQGVPTHTHDDLDSNWNCPNISTENGLFMGHRGFGYCERFVKQSGDSPFYLVALREPVSRFISLFDYLMAEDFPQFEEYHQMWKDRDLSELVLEANASLSSSRPHSKDVSASFAKLHDDVANQQTRYMCGWDCVRVKDNTVTLSLDEKLSRALTNLERADVVVVMEQLDDMIAQLKYHVNFIPDDVDVFPMENTPKGRKLKKSVLSPEALEVF